MTEVISVRMPSEKVAAIGRRAADSGLDRSKYLLRLVEQDPARPAPKSRRRFASTHLLGKFRSQGSTNAAIRAAVRAHAAKDSLTLVCSSPDWTLVILTTVGHSHYSNAKNAMAGLRTGST